MATSNYTPAGIFSAMEAQRDACDYAGRPVVYGRARAEQLVWLIENGKRDGRASDVRAWQAQLKPLMYLLED